MNQSKRISQFIHHKELTCYSWHKLHRSNLEYSRSILHPVKNRTISNFPWVEYSDQKSMSTCSTCCLFDNFHTRLVQIQWIRNKNTTRIQTQLLLELDYVISVLPQNASTFRHHISFACAYTFWTVIDSVCQR